MRLRDRPMRVAWGVLAAVLAGSGVRAGPVTSVSTLADGVACATGAGTVRLRAYSDRVVRVTFAAKGDAGAEGSLAVIARPVGEGWVVRETPEAIFLETAAVSARVDRGTSAVSFWGRDGKAILAEAPDGRSFAASPLKKPGVTSAAQAFALAPDDAIFGLGQHQKGTWNYRGSSVHLQQKNMDIAVPVLLSSKGYGVLWDNPAITDVEVGVKGAEDRLVWTSEAGEKIDYYFMFGPTPDEVIHGYRQLTGAAPMFGKWAWGYWQSRERYKTQEELLGVAREYRRRGIPIDGMVQDWQYWFPQPWGSHAFGTNFPDPRAMMDELHGANFHAIISVWGKFDKGSKNYDALEKAGYLLPPIYPNVYPKGESKWYDPFSAGAREMYWRQMSEEVFAFGWDGWWLDATEPELGGKWGEIRDLRTAAGPGYALANAYPLMTTTGVYQGQRAQTSDKRAFILTRSAYAGQQRNAAVSWSGDIGGNWATFKAQVPAGLNFVASGIPYWNTDIGGFFSGSNADEEYRELYVRWFQFGAFCPMFRSHGTNTQKEIWAFGPEAEKILVRYDRLRYRLVPYIYSTAWRVTSEDYTMMRPLVMDFPADATAREVGDQFMFGPSLMACPITEPSASATTVIPAASLADRDGAPGALTGTYFQGEAFNEQKLQRRDETIAFDWDKTKREGVGENAQRDPVPGLTMDRFSARWEGFLLTGEAGEYKLQLRADDGMRLWVDGKLLIEDWKARKLAIKTATATLPGNARVPVKIEYFQRTNEAIIELRWQPPGTPASPDPSRQVYLPAGTWTDFWTGKPVEGGRAIKVSAPLDTMPLYVRPGAIIPMGPAVQYAAEKSDPIEIRVYRGADGTFNLYEDEGDGYQYEKGARAVIPMSWDDKAGTLRIGARKGSFPGMLAERTFRVVIVGEGHGSGAGETEKADRVVRYVGDAVAVK